MFSAVNIFLHQGTDRDPPDFSYMPNTRKYILRNHIQGKCFPPKIFSSESWASLWLVLVKSQRGPERVPIKSRVCLGQVQAGSWVGPNQVPSGSRASLKRILGRSKRVLFKSRVGDQVLKGSWAGLGRVCPFENEMLKVEKLFMVRKLKKNFLSKRKYFPLTTILRCTKYCKIQ
jgi:hypothetical protein